MHCHEFQSRFLDEQSGTLPAAESGRIHAHLAACPHCRRAWDELGATLDTLGRVPLPEPGPRLRENFRAMLQDFERAGPETGPFAAAQGRLDRFFASLLPARPVLQAACLVAAIAVGVVLGARFAPDARTPSPLATSDREELEALRASLEAMPAFVSYPMRVSQRSDSDRLEDVLVVARSAPSNSSRQVLGRLMGTLAFDPSTNVRLSAVETLYAFRDIPEVQAGILASLARDPSPIVQTAMIDFLVSVRDTRAAPAFETLIRNPQLDQNVREAALRGLTQL